MKRASHILTSLALSVALAACAGGHRAQTAPTDTRAQTTAKARELASQGESAAKGGNLDKAIDLYRMSVATNPDFGAAWNNLGLLLWKRAKDTDIVQAGQAIPAIRGTYFYGDFCAGFVRSFRFTNGAPIERQDWPLLTTSQITSFGQDGLGELYLTTLKGTVFRIVQQ